MSQKNEVKLSKNFFNTKLKVVGMGVVIVIIIASVFLFISSKKESFGKREDGQLKITNQTIGSLVQNDTDKDGIQDWEETLWGTDKNNKMTFGIPDLAYVEGKKNELAVEQSDNDKTLTETERFAKEFFTSYSAITTSGADENTVKNFSNALGQKIGNPDLPDIYTYEDINISKNDTSQSKNEYYIKLSDLFDKHEATDGLGSELEIVSDGLVSYSSNGKGSGYEELFGIGEGYKSFASDAMKLSVPESLKEYHLQIVNSAYNTGLSVLNMTKVINDPVIGVSGVSQYQKYSKDLETSIADLEDILFNPLTEDENSDTMYFDDINQ